MNLISHNPCQIPLRDHRGEKIRCALGRGGGGELVFYLEECNVRDVETDVDGGGERKEKSQTAKNTLV